MSLQNNRLTGTVPAAVIALPNLSNLYIANNCLTIADTAALLAALKPPSGYEAAPFKLLF
jgi:hypothetical protein